MYMALIQGSFVLNAVISPNGFTVRILCMRIINLMDFVIMYWMICYLKVIELFNCAHWFFHNLEIDRITKFLVGNHV